MQQVKTPMRLTGKMKFWRLYLLHNVVVDRWYVGQTSGGMSRIKSHFKKSTANPFIFSDLLDHGIGSFRYRFLDGVLPTKNAATLAELIETVRRDTIFPRGYNRQIETMDFMTSKTWKKLIQVFETSRDFKDTGKMLPIPPL